MASSMRIFGTTDLTSWPAETRMPMHLHPDTRELIGEITGQLGEPTVTPRMFLRDLIRPGVR